MIYQKRWRKKAERRAIRNCVNKIQIENRGEIEVKMKLEALPIDSRETIR
jgi:hypothetical protein